MKKFLITVVIGGLFVVGGLFVGCVSPEAVHFVCVRESQTLYTTRDNAFSAEQIQPAVDRRYRACMAYHGIEPR